MVDAIQKSFSRMAISSFSKISLPEFDSCGFEIAR